MTKEKSNKKWKSSLLRSSLPLEFMVSEILANDGYASRSDFPYIRKNEEGIKKEFSVDIHAVKTLKDKTHDDIWGHLHLLIECKYSHPSVKWVFAPHPRANERFEKSYLEIVQDLSVDRISTEIIKKGVPNNIHCMKGVALHEANVDKIQIRKGEFQLKYANVNLLRALIGHQCEDTERSTIHVVGKILVTTAPLFVMKRGLSLDKIENAEDISDIADEVDSLMLYNLASSDLKEYARDKVIKWGRDLDIIDDFLEKYSQILSKKKYDDEFAIDSNDFIDKFRDASKCILVINFKSLNKNLDIIQTLTNKAGDTLKTYARKVFDEDGDWVGLEPI